MTTLTRDDVAEIHDFVALYGHIIDERGYAEMHRLFTEDTVFDASDFGLAVTRNIDELRALWASPDAGHPEAHYATNVFVEEVDGVVTVRSKGLGALSDGLVRTVVYHDVVRRTAGGWRFSERVVFRPRH